MTKREWPLVIFTLLIQMAVGTYLHLAVMPLFHNKQFSPAVAASLNFTASLVVLLLLILGVLSAILHLSRPLVAKNVFANVKSSWLSREAVMGISFGVIIVIAILLQMLTAANGTSLIVLASIGAFVGASLVYSMGRIYTLRTVPSWNTWLTPASFIVSTLLLGALLLSNIASLLFLAYSNQISGLSNGEILFEYLGMAAALLLTLQLLITVVKEQVHFRRKGAREQSFEQILNHFRTLRLFRGFFAVLGIALCLLFALLPFTSVGLGIDLYIIGAFLFALISETINRYLFFLSFKRSGL